MIVPRLFQLKDLHPAFAKKMAMIEASLSHGKIIHYKSQKLYKDLVSCSFPQICFG